MEKREGNGGGGGGGGGGGQDSARAPMQNNAHCKIMLKSASVRQRTGACSCRNTADCKGTHVTIIQRIEV